MLLVLSKGHTAPGCCATDEMWTCLGSGGDGGGGGAAVAPVSRCKHAAAVVAGAGGECEAVLLIGGRGAHGTTPLSDFWRYDLGSGRWRRLAGTGSPPPALQEHSALAHGDRLYVFGGEASLSDDTPLWVYHMQTEVWRKLPGAPWAGHARRGAARAARKVAATPRGRRGHTAHALPDCMLLYGGYLDLRGSTSELWAFHYESESWQLVRVSGVGPARHRHAAALLGRRLYVHGGRCDLRQCSDLWHYDTISHVWTSVRTPAKLSPAGRSGHAGLRAGPHFYIYGGEVDSRLTNELWRFHCGTETWERVEQGLQWPSPRADCAAVMVGRVCGEQGRGAGTARGAGDEQRRRGGAWPHGLLARLGGLGGARGQYAALRTDGSAESLGPPQLPKSRSAHAVVGRSQPPGRTLPSLLSMDSLPAARPQGTQPQDDDSDYASASAERLGFTNPHYLWGSSGSDSKALTPDSGAQELELLPLPPPQPPRAPPPCLLLLGGRQTHPAAQQARAPLSLWLCRLPQALP